MAVPQHDSSDNEMFTFDLEMAYHKSIPSVIHEQGFYSFEFLQFILSN